jgi:hypothetical protein
MKTHGYVLIIVLLVLSTTALFAQGNFNTSLHGTRPGKNYWYGTAHGGFESLTGIPVTSIGCVECHGATNADGAAYSGTYTPGCIDCHPSASGFNKDSIQVAQCYTCHSRQATEANSLGYHDVHRDRGMKCWDCHTSNDMHGSTTTFSSMLEPGAIEVECEDCHTSGGTAPMPDHTSYDPPSHNGKIHCAACHAKTVISCYNCHFESQVVMKKRAKQQLFDFVILANREKDGKVYPMSFQSLTYHGNSWVAFGPYSPHTIDSVGRTCSDCHNNMGDQNEAIKEYNSTGQIKFAKWNPADSTVSWIHNVVPMPEDYESSFRMDFLTYNGDSTDPVAPSKNWSPIGEDTWDGHQMFFASPLTKLQMAKLGFDTTLTSVREERGEIPSGYGLDQNYPNPFNPETKIRFRLPEGSTVSLRVFNTLGEEVATLLQERHLPAGTYSATLNGAELASGVYLYRLDSGDRSFTRKMVVLK